MELFWHTMEDLKKETNLLAIKGMCYMMWGNCYLQKPPEYFGEWMVLAGEKLGYVPLAENLEKNPPFVD